MDGIRSKIMVVCVVLIFLQGLLYRSGQQQCQVSVQWRNAVGRKLAEANDFGFLNIF